MVGTVGRTDLCGPELTVPLAHEMHRDEDAFVDRLVAGFGSFPTHFARLPELNRRGPRHYDTIPKLDVADLETFDQHRRAGAAVIDVRPIAAFADGHIPGSISNALRPGVASWLGWLIDPDRPIVFVADDDTDRTEVVRQCLDIGHEHLVGELDGGTATWAAADRPLGSIPLVGVDHLATTLLDVRQASEWETGHVPGAVHVELGELPDATIPDDPVTVMCGHGERARSAASLLAAGGRDHVTVLDGGPDTWESATGKTLETTP